MGDFFIDLLNYLVAGIGTVLSWLLSIFPDSPFSTAQSVPPAVSLEYISWLIPFNQMFLHLIIIVEAILAYYLIRVAARWIKLVRS